jgi:hypothetical protein
MVNSSKVESVTKKILPHRLSGWNRSLELLAGLDRRRAFASSEEYNAGPDPRRDSDR